MRTTLALAALALANTAYAQQAPASSPEMSPVVVSCDTIDEASHYVDQELHRGQATEFLQPFPSRWSMTVGCQLSRFEFAVPEIKLRIPSPQGTGAYWILEINGEVRQLSGDATPLTRYLVIYVKGDLI